jgi:hypothetical protein
MQWQDFEIADMHAIKSGTALLDLHNDYDFQSICFNASTNSVSLSWKRAAVYSPAAVATHITVRFENVQIFKTELLQVSAVATDSLVLNFVGFLHPDDLNVMDGCLLQEETDASYHAIFCFENGLSIKCHSESVICDMEL